MPDCLQPGRSSLPVHQPCPGCPLPPAPPAPCTCTFPHLLSGRVLCPCFGLVSSLISPCTVTASQGAERVGPVQAPAGAGRGPCSCGPFSAAVLQIVYMFQPSRETSFFWHLNFLLMITSLDSISYVPLPYLFLLLPFSNLHLPPPRPARGLYDCSSLALPATSASHFPKSRFLSAKSGLGKYL